MNNTGPALNEDEAYALASLLRHDSWQAMNLYLSRMKETAYLSLRSRNQSAEDHGYFKGIIQVIDDLQAMPRNLGKQIHGGKNNG